ncbi:MAG: 50S ribosome-binding GTPase [Rhodopseudomonas palustris]|nr:50S ribosome-binding GTPase [Rhodopseudomonas palustris]
MSSVVELQSLRLALVGTPNCGKTALFNALDRQPADRSRTTPGVTVERKAGTLHAPPAGRHVTRARPARRLQPARRARPTKTITRDVRARPARRRAAARSGASASPTPPTCG